MDLDQPADRRPSHGGDPSGTQGQFVGGLGGAGLAEGEKCISAKQGFSVGQEVAMTRHEGIEGGSGPAAGEGPSSGCVGSCTAREERSLANRGRPDAQPVRKVLFAIGVGLGHRMGRPKHGDAHNSSGYETRGPSHLQIDDALPDPLRHGFDSIGHVQLLVDVL